MFKKFVAAVSATSVSAFATAASAPAATVAVTATEAGWIAATLGFLAGLLLNWPALIILSVIGVLLENDENHGWAVFMGIIVVALSYFFFNISLLMLATGATGYIVIGLLWSFWRYRCHVRHEVAEYNLGNSPFGKENFMRSIRPLSMLSTIISWIIIWPFSMIGNVIGDFLNFIRSLVTTFFRGVYNRIYDSAVSTMK